MTAATICVVGAAEIVPGTVDPDVRDRPGIDSLAASSSSGVPNGSRVPWMNRHGTVELRQVLGRAVGRGVPGGWSG